MKRLREEREKAERDLAAVEGSLSEVWSWGFDWLIRLAREWDHGFIYFAKLDGLRTEFGRRLFLRQRPGGGYEDFALARGEVRP